MADAPVPAPFAPLVAASKLPLAGFDRTALTRGNIAIVNALLNGYGLPLPAATRDRRDTLCTPNWYNAFVNLTFIYFLQLAYSQWITKARNNEGRHHYFCAID